MAKTAAAAAISGEKKKKKNGGPKKIKRKLTSEGEEAKERNLVDCLFRVVNLRKETVMRVGAHSVVSTGHLRCERVRDVFGLDNVSSTTDFQDQKQEAKDNTGWEQILVHCERQREASKVDTFGANESLWIFVGEQIDGGKDIGTVHKNASHDCHKDEAVPELTPARIVDKVIHVDKVKLVVLNLLTFPLGAHRGSMILLCGEGEGRREGLFV